MPTYVMWICDWAYNRETALVNQGTYGDWMNLDYRLALNGTDSAEIKLVPNSTKLANIEVMKRLLIYRDGVLKFGGVILEKSWSEKTEPENNEFTMLALGGAWYADMRVIVPAAGQDYDERTDNADDLSKAYVTAHASASATVVARRWTDLTVQANAGACTSWTEQCRYENLLAECKKLAKLGGFDFRFVPSASGFEYQTAYPQWGLDRTFGNGVNEDMVFSTDRRNYSLMKYIKSAMDHRNYLYVGGQGEGQDQVIRERSTAGDITAYQRREAFVSASGYEDSTAVDYVGDLKLKEMQVLELLSVTPLATTWGQWDLGDIVTTVSRRYGTTYTSDAKVIAVGVKVGQDHIEVVEPEMEAV